MKNYGVDTKTDQYIHSIQAESLTVQGTGKPDSTFIFYNTKGDIIAAFPASNVSWAKEMSAEAIKEENETRSGGATIGLVG